MLGSMILSAMWGTLVLSSATPAVEIFARDERTAAALVVVVPAAGVETRLDISSAVGALSERIEAGTRVRAFSPERAGFEFAALQPCRSRRTLTCWIEAVLEQPVRGLEGGGDRFRFLALLSTSPVREGREVLSLLFFDLTRVDRLGQSDEELLDLGRLAESGAIDAGDQRDVARFLADTFSGELGAPLRERALSSCRGAVDLELDCEACALALDDIPLGIVRGRAARIEGLCEGERRISWSSVARDTSCTVTVDAGAASRVERADCVERALSAEVSKGGNFVFWSGVAATGAGGLLAGLGVLRSAGEEPELCASSGMCTALSRPGDPSPRSTFPLISLGIALAGGGSLTAGWSALEDEPSVWPAIAAGGVLTTLLFAITFFAGLH